MRVFVFALLSTLGVSTASAGEEDSAPIIFTEIAVAAGIDFVETIGDHEMSNIVESTGVGCGILDFDGDGWMDVFLISGCWLEGISDAGLDATERAALATATDRLYRNRGDGTFEDVTAKAGLAKPAFGMAVAAADYDGDGDTDLYVTNFGPNHLWRNNGDGTFSEVAVEAGVADADFGVGAVFLDYDRDGSIDLYLGNYLTFDPDQKLYDGADCFPGPLSYAGQQDRLFRGRGDGTFSDVTTDAGLEIKPVGRAMGVGAFDYDNDGYTDVFVSNDAMENYLLHNKADGSFENLALVSGVAFAENGDATAAMAVEAGDFDNDGLIDLFVPDMTHSCLYRNLGRGIFEDRAARSGIASAMGQYVSWGGILADFDLDGCLDLYVSNGDAHRLMPHSDVVFTSDGHGRFTDVSKTAGPWMQEKFVGRGAACVDFDNDGDQDVLVTNLNDRPALLRNDSPRKGRHWLSVSLSGRTPNRDALGALVTVETGGRKQHRQRRSGGSYLSQHDPRLHFGLSEHARVDLLTVTWPDGSVETLKDVAADRFMTVTQSAQSPSDSTGAHSGVFSEQRHREGGLASRPESPRE